MTSNEFHVSEKFQLTVLFLYIKAITRNSPDFSELLLWPDTQSFDIRGIPPGLEVLPLTQRYQTQLKKFRLKMRDRRLQVCSVQVTSLRLDQIILKSKFDFNNGTRIYKSIYSVMFYYFEGDLKHNFDFLIC